MQVEADFDACGLVGSYHIATVVYSGTCDLMLRRTFFTHILVTLDEDRLLVSFPVRLFCAHRRVDGVWSLLPTLNFELWTSFSYGRRVWGPWICYAAHDGTGRMSIWAPYSTSPYISNGTEVSKGASELVLSEDNGLSEKMMLIKNEHVAKWAIICTVIPVIIFIPHFFLGPEAMPSPPPPCLESKLYNDPCVYHDRTFYVCI